MSDLVPRLRIFLSSPSDVVAERQIALDVLRQLQYDPDLKGKVLLEPVAWDMPGGGPVMRAAIDPQEAINKGLPEPKACDIVIVILWARMGTPLPHPKYKKDNGEPYYSGAEWEFENAMQARRQRGRPEVVLYRRVDVPELKLDAPDLEAKLEQYKRVQAFFNQFCDRKTGANVGGWNSYEKPEDFRKHLTSHLKELIQEMMTAPAVPGAPRGSPSLPSWPGSPFPGLRPFEFKDAPIFFGRGRETDDLVDRINRDRFVTVVGASGSGKSSLVWAGLIPRLEANAISSDRTGSKDWLWLRLTPGGVGDNPFMALAVELKSYLHREPREVAGELAGDPAVLARLIPQILAGRSDWAELLLFIDQLEELVTLVSPTHRAPFVEMLCQSIAGGRLRAVATLRADFYHQMIPVSPAVVELLQNGSYPLGAPDAVSLYEMIVRPAERAGLQFEKNPAEGDLARRILKETGSDPGTLALMAYLLDELYQRRAAGGRLTRQAYDDLGGVAGAIGKRAEQVFTSLSPAAQAALPHVFRRLVEVDERGTATRRRALLADIERSAPTQAVEELLRKFTEARLLVATAPFKGSGEQELKDFTKARSPVTDMQGADSTVEVAHEALLRKWERLANWIEQTQDDLRLLRQVKLAAEEWNQKSRQEAYRWPHERLELVYKMIGRLELDEAHDFNEVEHEFIRRESDRLLEEIQKPETSHGRRRSIGERLAGIGDPRPGVGLRPDGLPEIDWCMVEVAGKSSVEVEIEWVGKVQVSLPFCITRYTVTYIQFQAFVDAPDGYDNPEIDWFAGLAADDKDKWPAEQRFKFDNHPRENVSWYEAMAFCRWLSWRLEALEHSTSTLGVRAPRPSQSHAALAAQRGGLSGSGPPRSPRRAFSLKDPFTWLVRLPTEAEWQFAAAGPLANTYPWGDDWDGRFANTWENGLSHTTAVGMYPAGVAACRALDMSGNVWEWTLTEIGSGKSDDITNQEPRVVRGGSWYGSRSTALATARDQNDPFDRDGSIGFRVVGVVRSP
jgi:formylglycine-generating enzyme required for sulfatase activity